MTTGRGGGYISLANEMGDRDISSLASRMQLLANATRLRILLLLRDGGLCACQVATVIEAPASVIAGHLADLSRAGILSRHRHGRFVRYALRRHDDVVPWLRLVARQTTNDPQLAGDHLRGTRIRLVPLEMLEASTGCHTEIEPNAPRRPAHGLGAA